MVKSTFIGQFDWLIDSHTAHKRTSQIMSLNNMYISISTFKRNHQYVPQYKRKEVIY